MARAIARAILGPKKSRDIQRWGSILAWVVILSVYGADTIAEVKLLFSLFLRWSLDLWNHLLGFLNNSNLHAIIPTSLLIIYNAVLEEIYNNVVPHWSAFLISCNHSITRLISFTKNASNQRSILSVYKPWSAPPPPHFIYISCVLCPSLAPVASSTPTLVY
jgi:hypothetical protein